MSTSPKSSRVLSGMRPTGRLHIGHYFGALQNWVRLQNEVLPSTESEESSSPLATRHSPLPSYDCFYFVADWHALTSDYADTSAIAENTLQITIDFLASGLDPRKSVIFLQSQVPEHAELHLLLSMITPLGWLERIPTYKEALENIKNKDLHTYGFLGYPTLQTADIVMYSDPGKGLFVPVGEDQVSHVEFSRELVRRFNLAYGELHLPDLPPATWSGLLTSIGIFDDASKRLLNLAYAGKVEEVKTGLKELFRHASLQEKGYYVKNGIGIQRPVLTEPSVLLTRTPRVPGLDGRKMSKSYGNAITLSESDADIRSKTKVMVTDPARKRRTDPGDPDICPVYDWHKLFSPPETLTWAAQGCRTAAIGCIECKSAMADNLVKWIEPVRDRRLAYEQNPKQVLQILDEGSQKASESAKRTMARVRESVLGWQSKRRSL